MSGCHGDWSGPCGVSWSYSRPMRSRRYSNSLTGSHHAVGSNREAGNLLPRRMGSAITTSPPLPGWALADVGLASTHSFLTIGISLVCPPPVTCQYAYGTVAGPSGMDPRPKRLRPEMTRDQTVADERAAGHGRC